MQCLRLAVDEQSSISEDNRDIAQSLLTYMESISGSSIVEMFHGQDGLDWTSVVDDIYTRLKLAEGTVESDTVTRKKKSGKRKTKKRRRT